MTITNGDQDKRVNLFRLIIFFHFFLSVSNFNLIFFNLTLHKQRVFSFSFLSMRIKSLKFYNGQKTSGNWQQLNIFWIFLHILLKLLLIHLPYIKASDIYQNLFICWHCDAHQRTSNFILHFNLLKDKLQGQFL